MNPKELIEHILFIQITDGISMVETDEIIQIIKKQIPQKPDWCKGAWFYVYCPNLSCRRNINHFGDIKFCPYCGQALDWSE